MKKLLLLSAFAATGFFSNAQQALRDNRVERVLIERPMVSHQSNTPVAPVHHHNGSQRAGTLGHVLNSTRIGSAGNPLTVLEGTSKQIDVNDSLNVVTFIHRNDPTLTVNTNVAQFRYDESKDRGNNWNSDIGPITVDPSIDNISVNGRFPQAVIYNPAGNSIVDSAYLIYSGTYHNSPPNSTTGNWVGQMRGRGQLSEVVASYDVHIDPINGGQVAIASGLHQGAPGVFWAINQNFTGTFATNSNQTTIGLIIEKGVWNTQTKDVTWSYQNIPQTFVDNTPSGSAVSQSIATSFNIAFDPSGKFGWAVCLGDIDNAANDSAYRPIFWRSIDSGTNWTGPLVVDLHQVQGVMEHLGANLSAAAGGTPASGIPTTGFEADLTVDALGNPHLVTTVGNGSSYSIEDATYDVWDITHNDNASAGCTWVGNHLAKINTLRGTLTTAGSGGTAAITEDNRPLVSRSPDGNKLFFFWTESDANFEGNENNDFPNLFGRAIDVAAKKITQIYNFTQGDTLWGGQTSDSASGIFGGATFPVVGQTCLVNGNNYNIPLVLTQIDYGHNPASGLGSPDNPAAFWYVNNLNIPAADFTGNIDSTPPIITLNGLDTMSILVGTTYNDPGATGVDCISGNVTVNSYGIPDTSQAGVYTEYYYATDASGNSDTVTRVIIVGGIPVADFNWTFPTLTYVAHFTDHSSNIPTAWHWTFNFPVLGDTTGSTFQNPVKTFDHDGTWNVCLVASNQFGTSPKVCKNVQSDAVGINEVSFAQHVSLYPNPSNGKVFIAIDENTTPEFTVAMYNALGEAVIAPAKYGVGTTKVEM
ncbi:MAG: hypothetical protein JWO06_2202, partial [Bacteroidota bacterium]|nr:hypothetical protein [Bacteroidota bacterium]